MSSLDEIVAEGKRLQEEYAADECASTWDAIVEHRNRIFPRLLAVAEAAVEMRNNIAELTQYGCQPSNEDIVRELAAFTAAAGEKGGE